MLRQLLASRLAGVRQLVSVAAEEAADRARLFGSELAVEQRRLVRLIAVTLGAVLVAVIAVVWAAATVVAFTWDTEWRHVALLALLASWLLAAVGLALWARALLAAARQSFPLSRRVAQDDLRRLREMLE